MKRNQADNPETTKTEEPPAQEPAKGSPWKRTPRLTATSFSIALTSSIFWAWLILSTFAPHMQLVFPMEGITYIFYLLAVLIAAGVAAIVSFKHSSIAFDFLGSMKTELVTVLFGSIGNIVTYLGIHFDFLPVIIGGGAIVGAVGVCYMLAWGRMYAPEGSRSVCLSASFGLALGAILASVISMLSGIACIVVTMVLPEVIMATLFLLRSMTEPGRVSSGEDDESCSEHSNGDAFGDADVFVKPQARTFGAKTLQEIFGHSKYYVANLSISLVAGLALFGFCIGFTLGEPGRYISSAGTLVSGPATSGALFMFGLIAMAAFVVMVTLVHHGAVTLTVMMVLGLAGFMVYPLDWPQPLLAIFHFCIPIGFLGMFVVLWTMLTEVSYSTGHDVVLGLSAGLATIFLGGAAGNAIALVFSLAGTSDDTILHISSIVGIFLAVSFVLICMVNSRLWEQVKENAFLFDEETEATETTAADEQAIQMSHDEQTIDEQAIKHGLTERETQVLRLLLMGRSRSRIAHALTLSENTVGTHVQHIYQKFGVHGLQELIDFVFTH